MASASPAFSIERNGQPVAAAERAKLLADPGFGRVFSDHMAIVRYSEAKGWHDARITARSPISLDPAAAVLHYAQEIFEGLKAYRLADGTLAMFRVGGREWERWNGALQETLQIGRASCRERV